MNSAFSPDQTRQLQELYATNQAARIALDYWKGLTRYREEAVIRNVWREMCNNGATLAQDAVRDVLKHLQKLDLCRIVENGEKVRWKFAHYAIAGEASKPSSPNAQSVPRATEIQQQPESFRTYELQLQGQFVPVRLPTQLPKVEAERLANFVMSLVAN